MPGIYAIAADLIIEGSNSLKVVGGDGLNRGLSGYRTSSILGWIKHYTYIGEGGDGIVADNISVHITGTLEVLGGNGGSGTAGSSNSDGDSGEAGGSGTNAERGGNAIKAAGIEFYSGTVIATGGNGGNGGNGGSGGVNVSSGGSGGSGGNGGYGTSCDVSNTPIISNRGASGSRGSNGSGT